MTDLQIIEELQSKFGFDNVKYYTVGYDYLTVELQIGYAEIHHEDLELITELTNLTTLKIAYSKINTKIQSLEKLTSLTWLAIVYSQVSKIQGLDKLTKLKRLYLCNNNIPKSQTKEFQAKYPKIKIYD